MGNLISRSARPPFMYRSTLLRKLRLATLALLVATLGVPMGVPWDILGGGDPGARSGVAYADEMHTIVIEGENAVSDNYPNASKLLPGASFSGGSLLRLETADPLPTGGYIASYSFTVPEAGTYALELATTPPEALWSSPYALSFNGEPYETVTGATEVANVNDTVRRYAAGHVTLAQGLNTVDVRVDTRRSLDQQYVLYLDAITLRQVPFGLQSLQADSPFRVFETGETVALTAVLAGAAPVATTLEVTLTDYWGGAAGSLTVPVSAGAETVPVSLGMLDRGHYTLTAQLAGIEDEVTSYVAVVPAAAERQQHEEAHFAIDGGSSLHINPSKLPGFADSLARLGVGWVRDRFHWSTVNPAPGVFDYSHFESTLAPIAAAGVRVLSTYQDSPDWTRQGGGSVPDDLMAAYQFARDSGTELADLVDAWEIGNEPDGHFTGTDETADQYAAFMKAAAIGYRDSGAGALLSISGFADRPNDYIRLVMANEVLPFLDIYSFHGYPLPYGNYTSEPVPFPNNAADHLAFVDQLSGGAQVQRWMTEAGIAVPIGAARDLSAVEQRAQARYLVTSAVQSVAAGVDRHFWFFMPHYLENGNEYGIFNAGDAPYAAYPAIATLTHALGEGRYIGERQGLPSGARGYTFMDGTTQVDVLWSETAQTINLPAVGTGGEVTDLMGDTQPAIPSAGMITVSIGPDPVYVAQSGVTGGGTPSTPVTPSPAALTAAERVVLTQRYEAEAVDQSKVFGAYRLSKHTANTVEVDVYNLHDAPFNGVIEATASGGWQLAQASQPVQVAAYGSATVTFELTAGPQVDNMVKAPVEFRAVAGTDSSTVSRALIMTGLEEVAIDPIAEAGVPANWDFTTGDAIPATGSYTVTSGVDPGTVRFKYAFTDTNQWVYPYLDLPSALDLTTASGIAFTIEAEEDIASTDIKLILVESNGSKYYTFNGFEIKAGVHRYVIPFAMLSIATFGPPDNNNALDLAQVERLQLGINTQLLDVPAFTLRELGTFVIQSGSGMEPSVEPPSPPAASASYVALSSDTRLQSLTVRAGDQTTELVPDTAASGAKSSDRAISAGDANGAASTAKATTGGDANGNGSDYTHQTEAAQIEIIARPRHPAATVAISREGVAGVANGEGATATAGDARVIDATNKEGANGVAGSDDLWALELGPNRFVVTVRAQDGSLGSYSLTITRQPPDDEAAVEADPDEGLTSTPAWSDVVGHWAESQIRTAMAAGIVRGYGDGTFRPGSAVTRAEFTVMLMRALASTGESVDEGKGEGQSEGEEEGEGSREEEEPPGFADQASIPSWAAPSIAAAVQAGYLQGYPDGTFQPGATITRLEMAVVLARAAGLMGNGTVTATTFADDAEILAWARDAVQIAADAGLVQGDAEHRFAPQRTASRADAVTVLMHLLDMR